MGRLFGFVIGAVVLASSTVPTAAHAQASIDFPLGIGFHVPSYDRVDGLSLPFGPTISWRDTVFVIEPAITYRSHLGKIDPSLSMTWRPKDSTVALTLDGGRGTHTNDRWIRSDLVNSAASLALGTDARNYYRGDRVEGKVVWTLPSEAGSTEVYAGALFENDWSTGWRLGEHRGPYSVIDRNDEVNGIDRPNPLIDRGHIGSGLAGLGGSYKTDRINVDARGRLEVAWHTPLGTRFQQYRLYEEGQFHTFGDQYLEVDVHGITTTGDAAPRQRWAYVGGSGTLATLDVLQLGGDHMYFIDALYVVPFSKLTVPVLGSFFVAPHYAVGAANVGGFGVPTANVGLRVGVGMVRIDYLVNPRTHKHDFSYGFSFTR